MTFFVNPFPQSFDINGDPAAQYNAFFGEPNQDPKLNPKAPFSDAAFTSPLPTTILLDNTGGYGIDIFLQGNYSLRIEDTLGALYRETPSFSGVEPISGISNGQTSIIQFLVSGTYNPTATVKSIQFIVTGGAGGGGGIDGQGAATAVVSRGGAGGGTAISNTNIIESSYAITVGTGGAGGVAGNFTGSIGSISTVVSGSQNITGINGFGGTGGLGIAGSVITAGVGGALSVGGEINLPGGGSGTTSIVDGNVGSVGYSGASYWGASRQTAFDADGLDGITFGVGGTGTSENDASTNRAGGDGGPGVVVIIEYF